MRETLAKDSLLMSKLSFRQSTCLHLGICRQHTFLSSLRLGRFHILSCRPVWEHSQVSALNGAA
jgi:hypothetical protein